MELTSGVGFCNIHRIPMMMVGLGDDSLAPTCVKCKAAAEPKSGVTVSAEDPGEEYFGAKAEKVKERHATVQVRSVSTLEEVVKTAVDNINSLPMPKDMKQFKAIQKAIKTLESLVEKSNG